MYSLFFCWVYKIVDFWGSLYNFCASESWVFSKKVSFLESEKAKSKNFFCKHHETKFFITYKKPFFANLLGVREIAEKWGALIIFVQSVSKYHFKQTSQSEFGVLTC